MPVRRVRQPTSIEPAFGQTCVSMLSASLKLYFLTWEKDLGVRTEETVSRIVRWLVVVYPVRHV